MMRDVLSSGGTTPDMSEQLMMSVIAGSNSSLHSLKKRRWKRVEIGRFYCGLLNDFVNVIL